MKRSPSASRRDPSRFSAALYLLAALTAGALLAGACGSSSTNLVGPTAQKCQISVTGFTGTFGPSGGAGSATIDAARECSWSASSQAAWISLSSAEGTGTGTLAFSVAANQVARARSGAVVVNGQQLTVSQAAAPCSFKVTASTSQVDASGGTGSISVTAVDGCSWTASSSAEWLRLSAASGNGSGGVTFSADPNAGADRTAVVSIAGQAVTIAQAGAPGGPTPTPPPPGCQVGVSPTALSFAAAGGQSTLHVTTSGCAWAATSDAWLTVSPQSGTKNATLTVTAAPNTSTSPRTGSVAVAGQVVAVDQAGSPPATPVQLTGEVSSRKGGCPAISFVVQGTSVVTDANTSFVNVSCDRLKNGAQVVVDGLQPQGQPVLATRVTLTGN